MARSHGENEIAGRIQDIRPAKRNDLREREVGDVVRDLKSLARELNIPVVATSHLNRNPEQRIGRRPMLDDLRESGVITFAVDTILLLHREDAYTLDTPRASEADFYVSKHRQGPTCTITTPFQGHYGRFVDMM
ncbi:DnaB-like helicase C-terminal domain-containing protein [Streptomyces sp. DH18]|uniref:DnaB-like helicase C-terminal domain-containing protein n=1 Tax=Streptomyces sp. DH18 TaxID=3040126 RepID=UPI0024417500|nr:DnaB-like helicase C-terminal domain-containing protein [Streptomyces sp. DH18]MDG9687739.1 DnaB-like helicase C-terminal domain-containing protein [Streptomyces sp. DH18]